MEKLSLFRATEGEPDRLDRFELIAELASGGMATVYLARLGGAGGFQRLVAIKRPHPHLARDAGFTEMFLDEARLAARLHHPHVVPILEIGESDGYYLVMEYIEGDTLGKLIARSTKAGKPLPAAITLRIGLDTLSGLHAAHELLDDEGRPLEIVHRDVSPQNILVGVDGSTRLTDFGVARATSRLTTTRSGELKGKMAYMAPEQARGRTCDRRADIFAMGIVLWESLANKRLFKGDGDAETLTRLLLEPIPTLRSAEPSVAEGVEAVVMKALEREPGDRFATCAEMAEALEEAGRAAGLEADHGDVAAHLQTLIGSDISQQREAVRAWLVREPSRPGDGPNGPSEGSRTRSRVPRANELQDDSRSRGPKAAELLDETRSVVMERTVAETSSSHRSDGSDGSARSDRVSTARGIDAVGDAAATRLLAAVDEPAPTPAAVEAPRRARRAPWLAAGLVLLLAGGVAAMKARSPSVATAVGPVPPSSPPQVTSAVATSAAGATAGASPSASEAPSDTAPTAAPETPRVQGASTVKPTGAPTSAGSAAEKKPAAVPARSPGGGTPARAASSAAAPPAPPASAVPALPPDMSYNPYR